MNIIQYIADFPRGRRKKEIERLAAACGVAYTTMRMAAYGVRSVSKSLALPLEIATKRKVKRYESRPDIYPPPRKHAFK